MAIDRAAARRRVRTITVWAAGGAAAMTAAFAFGAARGTHSAASASSRTPSRSRDTTPSTTPPQTSAPQGAYQQGPYPGYGGESGQGFVPPSSSTGPPAGMSGGS